MDRFNLPDGSLHYRLEGDAGKPVLLLSNSLGTDMTMWEPQIEALLGHFRVLRYDTRGHGGSLVTPGPYTMDQLGGDALMLIEGLGIERVHVAGVSLGGMTALWLAANAPAKVGRILPSFTSAHIGMPEIWNQRIATAESQGMQPLLDGVLARWFTPQFHAAAPATLARFRAMLGGQNPAGYAAACAAVRDMDLRARLKDISAPSLVVIGQHDLATPPAMGHAIAAGIADAKTAELPCAHIGNVEARDAYTSLLLDFLAA
ncbi:3-oxoadipate enol-lactonase [Ferrovibrio sp.]|uniref:3-oxoadipate enol-lactonase n=1 Tax=Ferrovibrio sp. TaxID=1917215 RepID=UPI0025BEFABA|nr:3-oxoadipate enol-lactonase [Ferrovibrio sp.]MBX3453864.1 3-oxoadipate enol-lactonase [Ferrovibrio sp.]